MDVLLKIRDLTVKVGEKTILNKLDLDIERHKNIILFGPNASGKSTLLGAIMGFDNYDIISGSIEFDGKNLLELKPDERARHGIGLMFQHPPKIRGIKLNQLADLLYGENKDPAEKDMLIKALNLEYLLQRDLNVDLSGGEIKRSELLQILLQSPKLLLLDEPESGVDIENVAVMSKAINQYMNRHKVSALIISHTGYILDYLEAKDGCVLYDGKIICHKEPKRIFSEIKEYGYGKCRECREYEI
jgi:Fe-S cluster assembly ATP-binding protein